jgi:osmoprotectant transport system ATP-binding protein
LESKQGVNPGASAGKARAEQAGVPGARSLRAGVEEGESGFTAKPSNVNAPAICFDHVSLLASGGRTILDNIELEIPSGATTALLGRSGSGKTTLLRMVNRLLEPSTGRVVVEGRATTAWDPIALRRSIGYVIQETGLFPHWSAERNMGAVPEISGSSREAIAGRVEQLFALVGLDYATLARRLPHQLSGGQRQRVGLARALAAEPSLLLMDEPFGALDPITRAEMQDMLLELLRGLNKTVLLVTHDLDEALYLSSHIVLLEAGQIAATLLAKDFLHSKIPAVESYVRAVRRDRITASEAMS